jgi:hypothetical protein
LVIPGEDLLDVRALWGDMQQYRCSIRYLGFNESQSSDTKDTRVHVSNNAVTSLPFVLKDSRVVQDRFEAVGGQDSQAYRCLKEYGPYHVVNLDLCGPMFPNTSKDPQEYYDALLRLLAYQFEHQKAEWLLCITTVVELAVVHADGFKKLCGPTRENWISPHLARLSSCNSLASRLGKWLIALCQKAQPQ